MSGRQVVTDDRTTSAPIHVDNSVYLQNRTLPSLPTPLPTGCNGGTFTRIPTLIMVAPVTSAAAVVLVVDDEPVVLQLMERTLQEAGYRSCGATSGPDALRVLETLESPPDAVVTDLRMQPMDGASLAKIIRQQWPGIPILLVSGYGPGNQSGELPGRLLPKPFDPELFLSAVDQLVPRPGA